MNKEALELKQSIVDSLEVKRIKELEKYIDSNPEIQLEFEELKKIQRQMVQANQSDRLVEYKELKTKYEAQMKYVKDLPFIEEYFELLEEVDLVLVNVCRTIEEEINLKL